MKNIYNYINKIIANDNTNTAKTYFENVSRIIDEENELIKEIKTNSDYITEYDKYMAAIFTAFYIYYKNNNLEVLKNTNEGKEKIFSDFCSENLEMYGWFLDVMKIKNSDELGKKLAERLDIVKYTRLIRFDSENYIKIDLQNNKIEFNIYKNKNTINI